GRIENGVYRSEWLGIEGALPPGMRVELGGDNLELLIERSDMGAVGAVAISDRFVNEEFIDRTFDEFARSVARDRNELQLVSSSRGRLPLGDCIERSWRVIGTSLTVRAVMVPICDRAGSLVFLQDRKSTR